MKDPDCPPDINPIVWEMRKVAIEGNIVPHSSYSNIVTISEGGKTRPHLLAITIMAEIIYWYRPSVEVDERTGIVSYHQKFHANKLQKSYSELAKKFGVEKRQAKEACDLLRRLGLISIEFRTIEVSGSKLYNVIFVEPNFESLLGMLFQPEGVVRNSVGGGTELRVTPHEKLRGYPTKKRKTYTHTTTETTPETTTTPVVVIDPEEEAEYHPDRINPYLRSEALTAAHYILQRFSNLPPEKVWHAAWVLSHQDTPIKMWPNAIVATIEKGIWHPKGCPTPSQLIAQKAKKKRKEESIRMQKESIEKRISEIELKFASLPETEKEKWRSIFQRRTNFIASHPEAVESGAIKEFAREVLHG